MLSSESCEVRISQKITDVLPEMLYFIFEASLVDDYEKNRRVNLFFFDGKYFEIKYQFGMRTQSEIGNLRLLPSEGCTGKAYETGL